MKSSLIKLMGLGLIPLTMTACLGNQQKANIAQTDSNSSLSVVAPIVPAQPEVSTAPPVTNNTSTINTPPANTNPTDGDTVGLLPNTCDAGVGFTYAGTLKINSGATKTNSTSVKLNIDRNEATMMKISQNSNCGCGVWEPYAPEKVINLNKANSLNNISVQFTDLDNIPTKCVSASILHDSNGPQITITPSAGNNYESTSSQSFIVRVVDENGSPFSSSCLLNTKSLGCNLQSGDNTITIPASSAGSYQLAIITTDDLGNSQTQQASWEIKLGLKKVAQDIEIKGNNKVDILMVIDNSGSMSFEQKSMSDRMSKFMTQIKDLDYRIAVTTTDPRNIELGDGRLVKMKGTDKYVLDKSFSLENAQTILGKTLQRSEVGSGSEQGINATFRAIERSLEQINVCKKSAASEHASTTAFSHANENSALFRQCREKEEKCRSESAVLFRDDANFATVLISDEDESATNYRNIPENLVKFIKTTWPTKNFAFHSIINKVGDEACRKTNGAAYGTIYTKMSQLTGLNTTGGSIIGSVCEYDYGSQLSGIGKSVQLMDQVMDLKCSPIDGKVSIKLNDKDFTAAFKVQDKKLVFENNLPIGNYKLEYSCQN